MLQRRSFLKYATLASTGTAFSFAFPSLQAAIASQKVRLGRLELRSTW